MRHVRLLAIAALAACGDDPLTELSASAMPVSTPEDTPQTFEIQTNLPITVQITTAPAHGTLTGEGTTWTFAPEADFNGSDQLELLASSGPQAIELTIPILITPVNDAPVGIADSFATNADSALAIDVDALLANDTDIEGDLLTITAVSSAVDGGAVLTGDLVTFTPTLGFAGLATFDYSVSDGTDTSTGTVSVSVGVDQAPVATDDVASTTEDVALAIDAATLLGNDTDADGHILAISDLGAFVNCTAVQVGSTITVTPDPDANGEASFEYTVTDGALDDIGKVTITIAAVADAPVAVADSAATAEDTTLQLAVDDLLENDSDADGDALTITAVNGTGASLGNGVVFFEPAADANGTATFTYTISDGTGNSATGTVTVTITAVPDDPIAGADDLTVPEDGSESTDVGLNDNDADGDALILQSFTQPENGVVSFTGLVATYTPTGNFNGDDSFTYTIADGTGGTATGTVSVTVTPINDAPVAGDDVAIVIEETPTVIATTDNDTDVDDDPLTVTTTGPAAHGTVDVTGGVVTYTPAANYTGPDAFDYTISDGNGGTDVGRVSLTVTNLNDPPVANPDTLGTDENVAVTANVVANDLDVDGDALTILSFTQASNGTVAFVGSSATYTPGTDFSGEDEFTYTISDGNGGTATGTVQVFVGLDNDPPVAVDDTVTVAEETTNTIDVLANDSDIDLDPLSVTAVTQADHGTVTLVSGVVRYTPADNYVGPDSFDYIVSDGLGGSDLGTVTIDVTNVNDTPTAVNDVLTTSEDLLATVNVTLNDTDLDGDTLAIQSSTPPAHGSVTFVATVARYTPAPNYHGPDSFTYTVTDGDGGTATATVTVTVTPVNDAPVAGDDNRTATEETATAIAVLGNDVDVDGDTVTVTAVGTAAHGIVALNAGAITYTPALNYVGPDAFDYTISDGNGGTDVGRVNLTVTNVNDPPVAVADSITTNEDTPRTVNVVTNDTDVDGDALAIQSVTQPAIGGSVTFAGGSVTFTPALDFNGTTSFTYTVRDPSATTSIATVNVTVNAANDTPVANADTLTVDEDVAGTVNVATNDTDADGDTLTIQSFTQPANGSVSFAGTVATFTPAANFDGSTSFTYTVRDPSGATASSSVAITVTAVDDAPVAVDDAITVDEDAAATVVNVRANDTDADGDAITVTALGSASSGTASLVGGVVTYQPEPNFNGTATFGYTITANGSTAVAIVTITVTAQPDPPVANDDTITIVEDTIPNAVVNVRANDTDADGDAITVTAVGAAANGTVTLIGGVVRYRPDPDFHGTDSFGYTITANGDTDSATVTVTVTPVQDAPVAADDTLTVDENAAATVVDVLDNDIDIDGDPITVTAVGTATSGAATLVNGVVRYQPAPQFSGTATFSYTITALGGTDTATVTVTVVAAGDPVAGDDAFTVAEDATDTVLDVTANDSDPGGAAIAVTAVTQPPNGAVTLTSGVVRYQPDPNFHGTDEFTYTITAGGDTATATVTMTVTPVNDAPVADANDAFSSGEPIQIVLSGSDLDGDALEFEIVAGPAGGSLGSIVQLDQTTAQIDYDPAGFTGTTSFTYVARDGTTSSAEATVQISVELVGCGDGNVDRDLGEFCDDGNQISGDGCDADCDFTCGSNGDDIIPDHVEVDPVSGHCFAGYAEETLDFALAASLCSDRGGHLATVSAPTEDEAVRKVVVSMSQDSWIDGNDIGEDEFVWTTTGEPFPAPGFFATGEPNDSSGEEDCLVAATSGWFDVRCDAQFVAVVCEFLDEPTCGNGVVEGTEECDDANPENGDGCDVGCTFSCASGSGARIVIVDPISKKCFAGFESDENHGTAAELCQGIGGQLATAETETERQAVLKATDVLRSGIAWIGATDFLEQGTFRWLTGAPVDLEQFAPGEPDFDGHCLASLIEPLGGWLDVDCGVQLPGTICELDAGSVETLFPAGSPAAIVFDNLRRHGTLTKPDH